MFLFLLKHLIKTSKKLVLLKKKLLNIESEHKVYSLLISVKVNFVLISMKRFCFLFFPLICFCSWAVQIRHLDTLLSWFQGKLLKSCRLLLLKETKNILKNFKGRPQLELYFDQITELTIRNLKIVAFSGFRILVPCQYKQMPYPLCYNAPQKWVCD